MEIELRFHGTPADFRVLVATYMMRLSQKKEAWLGVGQVSAAGNVVTAHLWGENSKKEMVAGLVVVHSLPDGTSLLVFTAKDNDWRYVVHNWEILLTEMQRQGRIIGDTETGLPKIEFGTKLSSTPLGEGEAGIAETKQVQSALSDGSVKQDKPNSEGDELKRPKRGRKDTLTADKLKHVTAYLKTQDRTTQENYCNANGISVRSLREWIGAYERGELTPD